mmetsp:Transcript_8046/g.12972  ORF Transcript_8046/g.12972 Transcript_8046/m.12972 type:complete len:121 (-) Transcript_8046:1104-1466(-)
MRSVKMCSKMALRMVEGEKKAVLVQNSKLKSVSILKLNFKGDALVHDGSRIMMISSDNIIKSTECVEEKDSEVTGLDLSSASEGEKRLAAVKRIYDRWMNGNSLDTNTLIHECHRYGFLS